MPFEKGHKKLGGRKSGSLNKKTLLKVEKTLLDNDINPMEELIKLAKSEDSSIEQKIGIYKEILKYTYPRVKAGEFQSSEVEQPTIIKIVGVSPNKRDSI